ncbi:MBL fold metallo-hydrolase [Candidatus Cryosericum terrychapinii]|uniref:MBL fold metallo-hydrolase n=1 Tax=Candidatus Cryosericum terrychapinii TaxID=2290919 RepID=A0A398CTF7_9BACT|nr:MBL fold metallo-hydrolase [Candidatus Cryosericum terrychapinii]RIE05862.1 MBL fold metallo-hydrolase [Candidatus Cryosericum terrychapinii]
MEQFHETMAGATVTRMLVGPLLTNCYLVQSGTELMLVDPGMVWNRELEEVATVIESANARLRWIVCTHGHFDHISGVDTAMRRFPDATLLMDPREVELARDPIANYAAQMGSMFAMHAEPSPLTTGQELPLGLITYHVATIHGHTPASSVLITGDHAFVGDTLFAGSVGRTPSQKEFEQLLAGIRATLMSLPPATRIFPGHGEPTTIAAEMGANPWL